MSAADDLTLPITVLSQRVLNGGNVGFDAITAYGRRITAVVPWWNTTAEGIDAALRRSWAAQREADDVRAAVLASYAADERDGYALVDTDVDATTG